ncbi:hypothetical protein [Aliamphritea spongicola]|nr:hypothetical protein [Aliamphritea spongicola]
MEKLDLYQRSLVDNYSDAELREEASRMARQIIRAGEIQLPEDADQALLLKETVAESIGLGLLEPLLEDESVTEIMVNGPDKVYIERFGQLQKSTACFTGNASLISVIERIVAPLGRRIDEGSPWWMHVCRMARG